MVSAVVGGARGRSITKFKKRSRKYRNLSQRKGRKFMSRRLRTSSFVTVLLTVGLYSLLATAQTVVNGDISGTVTDPGGAVVSGADVTIISMAEGGSQTTTTNATGLYRFSFLNPGSYKLTIGQKGFKAATQTVNVCVGRVATLNANVEAGT